MTADIYTHTFVEVEREAAIVLERAIYGDLFSVVPNIEVLHIWFKRSHVGILTGGVQHGGSMALR
jgi:hypothetical protein